MALNKYVVTALFLGGAAWLWVTGSNRVAAERQAVASTYGLGAQQMVVYDKCISAMERSVLRAGGSKQQFCGCLTRGELSDLPPDESDAVFGWILEGPPKQARVTDRQDRALLAALTCSEDIRSTWPSVEALQYWCAKEDARRELPQCKLGQK